MGNRRILIISDLHCPYEHPDAISFLTAIKKEYNPDHVVNIGDEADKHNLSFHQTDPDLPFSASSELRATRKVIAKIEALFPKVDVLHSNHGSLHFRKAKFHGIPTDYLRPYHEILFPNRKTGWKWHDQLILTLPNRQECLFAHGLGANYMLTAQKRGMSMVQGHYHSKYGIAYWSTNNELAFGMNVGCLIDDASLAFAYNKTTVERPIIGCGMIIDSQPKLIPLVMNKNGRWNRRLT